MMQHMMAAAMPLWPHCAWQGLPLAALVLPSLLLVLTGTLLAHLLLWWL